MSCAVISHTERRDELNEEHVFSKNKEYAQRLKELGGYERTIVALKLCDHVPS